MPLITNEYGNVNGGWRLMPYLLYQNELIRFEMIAAGGAVAQRVVV